MDDLSPELQEWNALCALVHAAEQDTPARRWWHLPVWHPAVGRALRIGRGTPEEFYALLPFRLGRDENDAAVVLAAWPCPKYLTPYDDWLGIEQVIAWNPISNTATIIGETGSHLIVDIEPSADLATIYADPRAFFQAWARDRAMFLAHRSAAKSNHWSSLPVEAGFRNAALVIGDVDRIAWRPSLMPPVIECVGVEPARLNRAIMRSARLPRVQSSMKAAA